MHLVAVGAGLALRPRSELGAVCLVDVGGAAQDRGTLLVVRLGPGRLGGRRRGSGARNVVDGRQAQREERASGRRLANVV